MEGEAARGRREREGGDKGLSPRSGGMWVGARDDTP